MTLKLSGPSKIEAGKELFTLHGAKHVCVILQPRGIPTTYSRSVDYLLPPSSIVSRQSLGLLLEMAGSSSEATVTGVLLKLSNLHGGLSRQRSGDVAMRKARIEIKCLAASGSSSLLHNTIQREMIWSGRQRPT